VSDVVAEDEHRVLQVLRQRIAAGSRPRGRDDGNRVVLAVEGGGNRGVLPGGMALELAESGLLQAFDAVYGSSSGALTGAWLLSSEIAKGLRAWTDPASYARSTRLWNPLRGRPIFDLRWLIEHYYDRTLGLDAASILANPISLHPLATDASTGMAVDLAPFIHDRTSLHTAMRASSAVPLLAGDPVELAGRRYLDAGLAESVPLDTPIAAGATHLLVLASRKDGDYTNDPAPVRALTARWLRRTAPGACETFLGRNARASSVAERLTHHNQDDTSQPAVLTVRPAADSPHVSRREGDAGVMRSAAGAGRAAMRAALSGATPASRHADLSH